MKLQHKTVDGEVLIRDLDSNHHHDLVAIVPLTDDEHYNKEVLDPFIESICSIPTYLKQIEAAEHLLQTLSECEEFLKTAEVHIHGALANLKTALRKN